MTIIQQPGAIALSGNIQPFIINSGSLVNFTLKEGVNILIQSTYEPDATGRIEIDVKDIIESRLKYNIKGDAFYEQTDIVKQFTATIDAETVTFKAIRTGVRDLADTPTNWLTGNFLTWQSQNKAVTYYSPEWLTYYATQTCTIKLKAYFPESIVQNVTLGTCGSGKAFTSNVQYAHIAGLLNSTYPTHYDVWAESSAGARLSFIQRYYFSEVLSEQEQWFLFENSLGGLDTLRASGETDLETENEHKLAIVNGEVQEYKVDTKQIFTKNTGHLTDYERRWLLDFPTARIKYIHHAGAIRMIGVTETNFRYATSDSPTDYSFKYRFVSQSSLLNLTRSEHLIPSSITIPDIDAPGFFLPPRLSELPRVELGEGVLIPAFDPLSDKPKVTTVGALISRATSEALDSLPGATEGGTLVQVIGEDSVLEPTDKNVFSGLRSIKEITTRIANSFDTLIASIQDKFIRKDAEDTAQEKITFEKGLESKGTTKLEDTTFGDFVSDILTGKGGKIGADGVAELQSLTLRSFLEAPEFRKNRVTLIGDKFIVGSGGIIEEVTPTATEGNYDIKLKLEEGDANPFDVGDIIEGLYHHATGFGTTWIGVNSRDGEWMNVSMRPNTANQTFFAPVPMMHIAHRGNFTNTARQSCIILSGRDGKIVMYDNVNDWNAGRVSSHWGKKQGLEFLDNFEDLPIGDNDAVMYLRTLLYQDLIKVDYQGNVVKEYRDRGTWSLSTAQSDPYIFSDTTEDEVWYQSEKFRVKTNGTTDTPSRTSPDWTLILSIKDDIDSVRDEIIADSPPIWKVEAVNIIPNAPNAIFRREANEALHQLTLRAKFTRNDVDVTDLMNTSGLRLYEFERRNMWGEDDNGNSDSGWNAANRGRTEVTLTHEDIVFIGNINMVFDDEILETEYQRLK